MLTNSVPKLLQEAISREFSGRIPERIQEKYRALQEKNTFDKFPEKRMLLRENKGWKER